VHRLALALSLSLGLVACSTSPPKRVGVAADFEGASPPSSAASASASAAPPRVAPAFVCLTPVAPRHMPEKRGAIAELVADEPVALFVNPSIAGVMLPAHLQAEPYVVLDVGRGLATPIPDLVVSDSAVEGTLRFADTPEKVRLPYAAIFGYVSHTTKKGGLYTSEIPAEAMCDASP
jgi:hypothetical protein